MAQDSDKSWIIWVLLFSIQPELEDKLKPADDLERKIKKNHFLYLLVKSRLALIASE